MKWVSFTARLSGVYHHGPGGRGHLSSVSGLAFHASERGSASSKKLGAHSACNSFYDFKDYLENCISAGIGAERRKFSLWESGCETRLGVLFTWDSEPSLCPNTRLGTVQLTPLGPVWKLAVILLIISRVWVVPKGLEASSPSPASPSGGLILYAETAARMECTTCFNSCSCSWE